MLSLGCSPAVIVMALENFKLAVNRTDNIGKELLFCITVHLMIC
jgi:hypothetical protein